MWNLEFNVCHWLIAVFVISNHDSFFSSAAFDKFKGSPGCPRMEFMCVENELCIPEAKHCDGHLDCVDGTDEHNCDVLRCLPPHYFECSNERCVSSNFLCDGDNDCEDWTDEKNCTDIDPEPSSCASEEFQCLDKLCIPTAWVCDGNSDCPDSSDETIGCTAHIDCDGFKCKNGFCIPKEFHCDGSSDCPDNSDEDNCPRREVSPADCSLDHRMFRCHDGLLCIELFDVCNSKNDCLDGSDEGGLCTEHGLCANATCPHDCFPSPTGALCTCPRGMLSDGRDCKDINECEHYGICDHKCTNFEGSYKCVCDPGYALDADLRTCKAQGAEGLMLFSSHKQIRAYFLTSQVYFPVARDLSQVTGVAYDGIHVYWTNVYHGEEAIMRSLEDGSNQEVIITAGLGTPEDLALDWITKNIYFTDSKFKHIGVCSNDGKHCTVLHNEDVDKPRGICLAATEGLMYWSDWGNRPLIARSGMDGSDVVDFISKDLHWPNGITIDHGNDRLYWVDAKLLVIESIKLDGTDRKVVLTESIKHPYALAVFENSIYWSDWTGQEIQKCNKFTGKDRQTVIREKKNRIFGIHIYHPAMMNSSVGNPCMDSGCSDLCLLAPRTHPLHYSCACPSDRVLAPNGHSCEQIQKSYSLVVGAGGNMIEVGYKRLGKLSMVPIPLRNIYKIGALAYDATNGHIIIYDTADKKIVSLDMVTGDTDVLVSGDLGKVEGMDVDPFGHNLYWADAERQTVEVFSLNSHERKILLRDLGGESPLDVVLIPEYGYLFVALMGPRAVHIDRFSMDGDLNTRTHIADRSVLGPNVALTYDKSIHHIFWSDSGTGHIETVDAEGMERIKVRELYHYPMDVAVIEDDVFWTNHGSASLLWANKFDNDTETSKQLSLSFTQGLESVRLVAVTGRVSEHLHSCQQNNGGCSHICLVTQASTQQLCTCPSEMILRPDGRTCETPRDCRRDQFRCSSGQCIQESLKCNGQRDCPDGADEKDCRTTILNCAKGQFSCHNGERCLEHRNRCDGIFDCSDRSDELNCLELLSPTCKPGEFQCSSGACVPNTWQCDGTIDCEDGTDERFCEKATCHPEHEFRCTSGTCIPSSWECDGQHDCHDGSDEHQSCLSKSKCGPDQLTCHNSHCVDRQLACDGVDDCEDGADEENCSSPREEGPQVAVPVDGTTSKPLRPHCDDTEFTCDICLPAIARCNGTAECLRGEDETGCSGCLDHQFQCRGSGRCILQDWTCDGANDCGDNSDEDPSMCRSSRITTNVHHYGECLEFTCGNKKCLSFRKVCDGKSDCEDGSDEGGRCGRGCKDAGCTSTCQETPSGPKCGCLAGYQLSGDSRSCNDVDECALGVYCAQYCHNTPGSYSCSCHYPDYQLRDNRMTCKAKGHEMQMVYFSDHEIRYVTESRSSLGLVFSSPSTNFYVTNLEVDARRRCVYWSSAFFGTISRKCLATKNPVETIGMLVRPGKLALDWVTENIYFVEKGHTVKVCHFGVKQCALVVTAPGEVTVDTLSVDPIRKLMFWSEHDGDKSVIKRANLAGSSVSVVVSEGLGQLADLALDHIHQTVYWLEQDHRVVERVAYNGSTKQTVFASPDIPVKIALFEHSVYWMVESNSPMRRQHLNTHGNVWQCALSGPSAKRCDILKLHTRDSLSTPTTFAIMQEATQEQAPSECSTQCTNVCVTGGICLCPDGARVHPGQACADTTDTGYPHFSTDEPEESSSLLWSVFKVMVISFIVLPAIVAIVFVLRYDIMTIYHNCVNAVKKPVFSNIHFNNPAYNVSASHLETVFHHSRLNPGEHQYENPIAFDNMSSGTDGTVSTITNEINEKKKQKVIEFHITDFADDDSGSLEYSEAMGESHKTPLIR